jgi:transposase
MQSVVTVGLDIAKNVFQAHGVDAEGGVAFRRRITQAKVKEFFASLPKCLVGIEACASSHHWAREIGALGHTVKLMPPAYVKPYVKSQKNDSADAEAICEAVTRPNMRFAEVKSVEQQSVLAPRHADPSSNARWKQQTCAHGGVRGYRSNRSCRTGKLGADHLR